MTLPTVSVIVVNYNSGARLAKCIAHLRAQHAAPNEIIIVDNASSDGSADFVNDAEDIRLINAGANIGFAAANNLAAGQASGDWLAFLNPDAYAEPDWIAALVDAAAHYDGVAAFGSLQIDAAHPARLDGAGDVYHAFGLAYRGHHGWPADKAPVTDRACFAPCAAASMIRRDVFLRLGGFEETFFCYSEDVDLGFKIRLDGGVAIQLADACVRHEGSAISGVGSDFTIYHGHRNRVWTYWLNMPLPLLMASLPFNTALNFYLLARFALLGKARPYIRAMVDAHRALPKVLAMRAARQKSRTASTLDIARALAWSPLALMRRRAVLRDVPARAIRPRTTDA